MEIRKATIDDYDLFVQMNQEIHLLHVQAHPSIFKPTIQISKSIFKEFITLPEFLMSLAIENGACIGYVFCEMVTMPETPYTYERKFAYIRHIYIQPAMRGKGIATQLLNLVKEFALKNQLTHVDLDVWTFNEAAHSLFKKFGFLSQKDRMTLELKPI